MKRPYRKSIERHKKPFQPEGLFSMPGPLCIQGGFVYNKKLDRENKSIQESGQR